MCCVAGGLFPSLIESVRQLWNVVQRSDDAVLDADIDERGFVQGDGLRSRNGSGVENVDTEH